LFACRDRQKNYYEIDWKDNYGIKQNRRQRQNINGYDYEIIISQRANLEMINEKIN
jgi:hypothetical protein